MSNISRTTGGGRGGWFEPTKSGRLINGRTRWPESRPRPSSGNSSGGRRWGVIEPPPRRPSLQAAAEWVIRALRDEGLPVLLAGRGALDYQQEYTWTPGPRISGCS